MHRVLRGLDDVAHDGAGRRRVAGAPAFQHHILEGMAVQVNRVQGSVHAGKRMVRRQEDRMHAGFNGIPVILADGQQFQHIAHLPAEGDILGGHLRDALPVYILHLHPAVESQGAQDAQLVGRVEALDIRRGIGLGQAQPLRVLQHVLIFGAFRRHPGQDVVGRAVHNTHDLFNMVRDQRALDRVDDRDRAADAGFVVQPRAGLLRHGAQLVKVQAQRHLVGSHHGFPVFQRTQHHGGCRLLAAEELTDDLDFRILQDIILVRGQHLVRDLLAAVEALIQHQGLLHAQRHARPGFHLAAECPDQVPDTSADISQSEQSQHNLFHCHFPPSVEFRS